MKIITNYRYWVLLLLACAGCIGIFSMPDTELDFWMWLYVILSSKTLAIVDIYVTIMLLNHWERKGKINELSELVNRD